MKETIVLISELKSIENNINQIAKKINSLQQISEFKQPLFLFDIVQKGFPIRWKR